MNEATHLTEFYYGSFFIQIRTGWCVISMNDILLKGYFNHSVKEVLPIIFKYMDDIIVGKKGL